MSFSTISQSAVDQALIDRVTAATEQEAWNNPTSAGTDFGHQVQVSALSALAMVWPVCIAAGAFGENVPARDLFVSPDHAISIDGGLVPVRLLVNGASIIREPSGR